jgi:hypothetical protein
MAINFRRRIKIFPGFYLNLGKRGIGASAGVSGARVGIGKKGPYFSLGIPGTGLFFKEFFKNLKKRK